MFFASRATALGWNEHAPAHYVPHEFLDDAERRADVAEKKAADIEDVTAQEIADLHCALRDLVLALDAGIDADIRAARDEAGRALA